MKSQLPSKYPWKSSREPPGVREPQVENPCSKQTLKAQLFKDGNAANQVVSPGKVSQQFPIRSWNFFCVCARACVCV